MDQLERFYQAYVECALWSSTDDEDRPMDSLCLDLAPEAEAAMRKDCEAFMSVNGKLIEHAMTIDQAGYDFWLTRNHHGAGFWDRGLGELGNTLTELAHAYGDSNLYVGDDGLIHCI